MTEKWVLRLTKPQTQLAPDLPNAKTNGFKCIEEGLVTEAAAARLGFRSGLREIFSAQPFGATQVRNTSLL